MAFKATRARIKADPVLSRVVKRWYAKHPDKPTMADLPYVVIGMKAGPISVGTVTSHNATIHVGIDYVVDASGTNEETAWEDLVNLYGQIEKAVNPFGDIAWLRNPVQAVDPTAVVNGIPRFTQQGFDTIPLAGIDAIGASCVITLPLQIDTCRGKQS